MTGTVRAFGFLAAAALLLPTVAEAQNPPPPERPLETELVFDREVFQYPSFTRRNPFRPLLASDAGGPRFERLTLIGIVYSDDPSQSVAVLSTGGLSIAEDGTTQPIAGDAHYLKVGQSVGNTTVRAIHRDRVDVVVTEFDEQIPRTMIFVSRRPGGTP
jgi:hypothetical protein